jgi:hypothetical protein
VTSCCSAFSFPIPQFHKHSLFLFLCRLLAYARFNLSSGASSSVIVIINIQPRISRLTAILKWERESIKHATRQQYAVPIISLANSTRRSADDFADNHDHYATSSSIRIRGRDSIPITFPTSPPPAYSTPSPPAYSPIPPGHEPTTLGLDDPALWSNAEPPPTATGSFHPRAAVILGLNNHWHKWLYFCRLLSVFPELRFGIPMLWTLLSFLLGHEEVRENFKAGGNLVVVFVEVFLAAIWVTLTLTDLRNEI